ncbi:MAG: prepilin-type N-terminal cleavage/methylation domain-containing protein [bacterium]|nr:prepilin-type N-terminal cleavage/methylation domain-containing protein [bacterium]
MPRKKAFTLIELMIVMVIIGILILIGMGLNRSQLKSLKASTAVEAFQARFDTLFLQIITSNHHRASPYHQLKIQLTTASEEQDSVMNYYFEKLD